MKLSLITALSLSLAAAALTGCSDDPPAPEKAVTPTEPPAAETPATPTGPQRKLVTGRALATDPTNLLLDPGFALAGEGPGYGSFLAVEESSNGLLQLDTTIDSRAPSGFAGSYAIVRPTGGTDKRSDPVTMLAGFVGGAGPYAVEVWISKSDTKERPTALAAGEVTVTVAEDDPQAPGFDLSPVDDAKRVVGDRTWTLFRGEVPTPLPYGGYVVIRTGEKGGHFLVAAPQVSAAPLAKGLATTSLKSSSTVVRRTLTRSERAAIQTYQKLPKRLMPPTLKRHAH